MIERFMDVGGCRVEGVGLIRSGLWGILMVAAVACVFTTSATAETQSINFDDLKRPASHSDKSWSLSGIPSEASGYLKQFSEIDDVRVTQHQASRAAAANNSNNTYCSSSDTCFEVESSNRGETSIKCTKGAQYKIGQVYKICGPDSKGKWAMGCGMTYAFAYHYTLKEAGNGACN